MTNTNIFWYELRVLLTILAFFTFASGIFMEAVPPHTMSRLEFILRCLPTTWLGILVGHVLYSIVDWLLKSV